MSSQSAGHDSSLLQHWHRFGYERTVANTQRFLAMVSPLTDAQLETPVPGLSWRVIDVVAHVASVFRRYTTNPRRAADRDDLRRQNAAEVDEMGDDLATLVADIEKQVTAMGRLTGLPDPEAEYPFHAGQTLTLAGSWGNALGELLAHGDDVARPLGLEWTLPDDDLEPFWRFTARAMPGWLTPDGLTANDRWRLDLGFDSGPVDLSFEEGRVVIDDGTGREPDFTITQAAAPFTTAVPYRRRSPQGPEAQALQERIAPL